MNNIDIYVEWTGDYPTLCHGRWMILINNREIKIPKSKKFKNMNTYGEYSLYTLGSNYEEEISTYKDGLIFKDWIEENLWLKEEIIKIFPDISEDNLIKLCEEIYDEINRQDFREGFCGGCL